MASKKLTEKREAFCQAYAKYGLTKGPDAYREAGYSVKNMSDESIRVEVFKLLQNPNVSQRIEELQKQAAEIAKEKFNIDTEEILRYLDILRKSRIDEYVEFKTFEIPVTKTETVGSGKNKTTITTTTTEFKTELRFKTFDQLTEQQLMCIESVKQNRYGEVELKLHGKEWTTEKISKHIGFYEKDNKQKTPVVQITGMRIIKDGSDS